MTEPANTSSKRRSVSVALIERNVLLIGPSGGGKSEIINALRDYGLTEARPSRLDPKSVTQDSIYAVPPLNYSLPNGTFTLRLFDTRGLTDSSASFIEMVPKWNEMVSREITRLHFVLFVLPVDRLSKSLLQEVAMMMEFLTNWGMKAENVIVVLNKCDFFDGNMWSLISTALNSVIELPEIIRNAPLLRCCFLNPRVVVPAVTTAAEERMVDSTNRLADILLTPNDVLPFYPRQAILAEEIRVAEEKRRAAVAEIERLRND